MKQIKLSNGIELEFERDSHTYYRDGEVVDGVTTILNVISKPKLKYWAVSQAIGHLQDCLEPDTEYSEEEIEDFLKKARNQHNKTRHTSANLGSKIHKWLEDWINGEDPEVDGRIEEVVNSFLTWYEDEDIEFLEAERVVYSEEWNYCGTLDFLAKYNDELVVGDFKTSKNVYPSHILQTSAYQNAYQEETSDEVDGRLIIRLDKYGGEIETLYTDEFDEDFKAFKSALILQRRLDEIK